MQDQDGFEETELSFFSAWLTSEAKRQEDLTLAYSSFVPDPTPHPSDDNEDLSENGNPSQHVTYDEYSDHDDHLDDTNPDAFDTHNDPNYYHHDAGDDYNHSNQDYQEEDDTYRYADAPAPDQDEPYNDDDDAQTPDQDDPYNDDDDAQTPEQDEPYNEDDTYHASHPWDANSQPIDYDQDQESYHDNYYDQ